MNEEKLSIKIITFLSTFDGVTAYSLILGVLLACGLGLPIPEDVTLVAAGVLAGVKNISLAGAMIAGFFGVLAGDTILFFLGRKLGRRALTLPGFRVVFTPRRMALAEQRVVENSQFICFTARFLPGLRAPIYFTAGMMGVRPIVFLGWDSFAALISVPVWVLGGYYLATNLEHVEKFLKTSQLSILAAVAVGVIFYLGYRRWRNRKSLTPGVTQLK